MGYGSELGPLQPDEMCIIIGHFFARCLLDEGLFLLVLCELDGRCANCNKEDDSRGAELNPSKCLIEDETVADERIEYTYVADERDEA